MAASGTYISDTDLYAFFGQTNIDKWSDLETAGYASAEARRQKAIEVAEAQVEGRFRGGRYTLPFAFTGTDLTTLKNWMAVIAGRWLQTGRPIDEDQQAHLEDIYESTMDDMENYIAGIAEFNTGWADATEPSAPGAD